MRYLVLFLLMCMPCWAANTWYVWPDAIGNADGTTWANAYTSLSAAEAAKNADITGIAGGVIFECKVTTTKDTAVVSLNGWTTDADSPITVQSTDRTYHLQVSNSIAVTVVEDYTIFDGVIIETAATNGAAQDCMKIYVQTATNNLTQIKNCTFKGANHADYYQCGIYITDVDAKVNIWNTVIYNISAMDNTTNCGIYIDNSNTVNIYNTTISGGNYGINATVGTINCKNVLAVNALTYSFYDAGATMNMINCMADDTSFASQTFDTETACHDSGANTFTGIFRLTAGDAAIDEGVDLSGDTPAITVDIDGIARGATYDIGCSEYEAPPAAGSKGFRRAIRW
jgi:hypothetical protein